MKKNIGTKIVWADPTVDGYEVIYKNGYRGWCSKKAFEEVYRLFEEIDFEIGEEYLRDYNDKAPAPGHNWNGVRSVIC